MYECRLKLKWKILACTLGKFAKPAKPAKKKKSGASWIFIAKKQPLEIAQWNPYFNLFWSNVDLKNQRYQKLINVSISYKTWMKEIFNTLMENFEIGKYALLIKLGGRYFFYDIFPVSLRKTEATLKINILFFCKIYIKLFLQSVRTL